MIKFYKPNFKNTGIAVQFKIGLNKKEDYSIYFNGVKQYSWNQTNRSGSFTENSKDPSKIFNIKFNEFEISALISLFESGEKWSVFHGFDNNQTSISFYLSQIEGKNPRAVFSFSIVRNGADKFSGFFELSETRLIIEYFKWYLNKLFDLRMQNDKIFNNNQNISSNSEDYMSKFERENKIEISDEPQF